MLVLKVDLHHVEELFHGVVENTEICASPDDILFYDFDLVAEPITTFVKEIEEMVVLVVSRLDLLTD